METVNHELAWQAKHNRSIVHVFFVPFERWWLRKLFGFRHVFAYCEYYDDKGFPFVGYRVESLFGRLDLEILKPMQICEDMVKFHLAGWVSFSINPRVCNPTIRPDLLTCVSVIRQLLGINKFILTPRGLFKEVRREYFQR